MSAAFVNDFIFQIISSFSSLLTFIPYLYVSCFVGIVSNLFNEDNGLPHANIAFEFPAIVVLIHLYLFFHSLILLLVDMFEH
jgi:hypothetical protein